MHFVNAPRQIDATHYTQGEQFMLEKARLFAREWLPVCGVSQLVRSGDYLGHVIGGWPIVAVHTGDGIRLFRNTCRHQSMMVLDKPAGNCAVIQCRYHGWQYKLDGSFVSAPALVAPPADAGRDAVDLTGLQLHRAAGLLFGHLGAGDQRLSLDQALADSIGATTDHDQPVAVTTLDVGCNWKVLVEHALASGLPYQWPLLATRSLPTGVQMLQIVPRSFLRTRVVSHVWGIGDGATAIAQAAIALEQDKTTCEALQARYAQGDLTAPQTVSGHATAAGCTDRIMAFRHRVLEIVSE